MAAVGVVRWFGFWHYWWPFYGWIKAESIFLLLSVDCFKISKTMLMGAKSWHHLNVHFFFILRYRWFVGWALVRAVHASSRSRSAHSRWYHLQDFEGRKQRQIGRMRWWETCGAHSHGTFGFVGSKSKSTIAQASLAVWHCIESVLRMDIRLIWGHQPSLDVNWLRNWNECRSTSTTFWPLLMFKIK